MSDAVCSACLGRGTVLVWSINQEAVTMPCPDGCEEDDDEALPDQAMQEGLRG